MIHEQNSSQQLYAKRLTELAPVLQRIATTSTRVIWLRQYPVIDFFGSSESHNTDIFSSKINQFNVESERILRHAINRLISGDCYGKSEIEFILRLMFSVCYIGTAG